MKIQDIRNINLMQAKLLERIYRDSSHHQVRQRAHCLLLIRRGIQVEELQTIFQVSYKTIYNWMNQWESKGLVGLYNQPGQGRKPTFNQGQREQIKSWTEEEPRQLKRVILKIREQWQINTSKKTVQRILKNLKMSWHRMRRGIAGQPNREDYDKGKAKLEELKQSEERGEIQLYYLDETGFGLIPNVPYGWQNQGEYLTIPSQRSRRLNVLGIMNRDNHLEAYVSEQSINSDVISYCIESWFPTKTEQPTVIVIYQASIHTSGIILDQLEEWQERNITLFQLPAYSPHLNLIEILWRFIKYEWLEVEAYSSWNCFVASVEKILREFGNTYVINFV
jgi:transposase